VAADALGGLDRFLGFGLSGDLTAEAGEEDVEGVAGFSGSGRSEHAAAVDAEFLREPTWNSGKLIAVRIPGTAVSTAWLWFWMERMWAVS